MIKVCNVTDTSGGLTLAVKKTSDELYYTVLQECGEELWLCGDCKAQVVDKFGGGEEA